MAVFTGKTIIITGASEGIGRAICVALAPQKPNLVLAARNGERLNELCDEVEKFGAKAITVRTDVMEESACKNLIDCAVNEFGGIDVLVNNAGQTMWTWLEDMENTSILERLMRINYLGSAYCAYYALPYLKESKGRIVAVSSIAGIFGTPSRTAYSASKHAMFGFFKSLRMELAGTGVTVTMVAPDFVETEIHRRALDRHGNPLVKSPMDYSGVMSAEKCAGMIVKAMEKRKRLLITSNRAKVARWAAMIAPGFLDMMTIDALKRASGGQRF